MKIVIVLFNILMRSVFFFSNQLNTWPQFERRKANTTTTNRTKHLVFEKHFFFRISFFSRLLPSRPMVSFHMHPSQFYFHCCVDAEPTKSFHTQYNWGIGKVFINFVSFEIPMFNLINGLSQKRDTVVVGGWGRKCRNSRRQTICISNGNYSIALIKSNFYFCSRRRRLAR